MRTNDVSSSRLFSADAASTGSRLSEADGRLQPLQSQPALTSASTASPRLQALDGITIWRPDGPFSPGLPGPISLD